MLVELGRGRQGELRRLDVVGAAVWLRVWTGAEGGGLRGERGGPAAAQAGCVDARGVGVCVGGGEGDTRRTWRPVMFSMRNESTKSCRPSVMLIVAGGSCRYGGVVGSRGGEEDLVGVS